MKSNIYRVQMSAGDWILRHPEHPIALLKHTDKEELIKLLPFYFKRTKEPVTLKILSDFGVPMDELTFNTIEVALE